MPASIDQLVERASQLANAGRWDDAEHVWREIRNRDPQHPRALFSLGVHALKRGDGKSAHELLCAARKVAPTDLLLLMTLCAACHQLGDAEGEREAIEAALTQDPYFLPALLAKGSWLERFGTQAAAAATFANALKVAPPPTHWPANLRRELEHAREVVDRHAEAFSAFLNRELADRLARLAANASRRAGARRPRSWRASRSRIGPSPISSMSRVCRRCRSSTARSFHFSRRSRRRRTSSARS